MNALRSCQSRLVARSVIGRLQSFCKTSVLPRTAPSVLRASSNRCLLKPTREREQSFAHYQINKRSGQIPASSLAISEVSTMRDIGQDHSSFANYLQAVVTHVDLGKTEICLICCSSDAVAEVSVHAQTSQCILTARQLGAQPRQTLAFSRPFFTMSASARVY